MQEAKSPERLVFFTDAVIAIALTLLVLPLTDIAPELAAAHGDPVEAITGHQWQIGSFLLSFLVIGRQWMNHRQLFGHVVECDNALVLMNMVWLLTVVIVPFPTQLVGAFGADHFTCLCYIGTIAANSLCLTGLVAMVRGNPRLTGGPGVVSDHRWINSAGSAACLLVAFVLVVLVPGVGYFAILLLLLPSLAGKLLRTAG